MGSEKTQQDGPATEALPALDFTLARAGKKYVDLIKQGKINSAPVYGYEKLLDLMHPSKGGLGGFNSRCFWFMGSDLHKPLELAWGKADGMVPGKYKRARLFAFEAPDVLVIANTETGDRGSGWHAARKADLGGPVSSWVQVGSMESSWSPHELSQVGSALRQIVMECAQVDRETHEHFEKCAKEWLESLCSAAPPKPRRGGP